jgi:AraC-like DNA-binding protein
MALATTDMNSVKTKKSQNSHPTVHKVKHNHFDTLAEPPRKQLLAWRDRVGHIIDVLPTFEQVNQPFHASIDRYQIGEKVFTDCRSDAVVLDRSIARISTDDKRDYVFHVFTEGGMESVEGINIQPSSNHSMASILAVDLNQPIRMRRSPCRMLTLFVPREDIEAIFPNAESIHGRVFENTTPLTQLLIEQVASLTDTLPGMNAVNASHTIDNCSQLLVAAFSKKANLSGSARAAVRAAMFNKTRRYIQNNLHQAALSPESVMQALQLPRPSIYRLFEHEGGLATYIRNRRLREAADELIRFPNLSIVEIAYGLGFKSASDFARAFRRNYAMTPQEMRAAALERLLNSVD